MTFRLAFLLVSIFLVGSCQKEWNDSSLQRGRLLYMYLAFGLAFDPDLPVVAVEATGGNQEITLTWQPAVGAASYHIYAAQIRVSTLPRKA